MNHHIITKMAVMIKIIMSKLVLVVVLCPVIKIRSSFLNIEEIQKLKYGVEISGEPVLLNQDTDENIMHITSKHGQQYQCIFPVIHAESEENRAKNISTDEINVLLESFNHTCLYFLDGWWTYKACFGRSVYQYHDDGNELRKVKDNINLGDYAGETDWSKVTIEEHSASKQRYHSQFYTNGTLCALTGKLRETEVRFFCDKRDTDYIARIDESSTCVYVITVYTNKLCNHPLFRPKQAPKRHSITCSPALVEEQYKKYTEAKVEEVGDIPVDDLLSSDVEIKGNQGIEKEPKKRTPSIFEALAELFHKGGKEENKGVDSDDTRGQDDDEKINWEDVLKKSRNAIDKSVERIRKLELHEKLTDEVDQEKSTDAEDSREPEQQPMKGVKVISNYDSYKRAKRKQEKDSIHYQELIESLKIEYRYFKRQMDIVTSDLRRKIGKLENGPGKVNPVVTRMAERIKETVRQFEENQRTLDFEMERLTDLNDSVMKDTNPSILKEEIADIRSRLYKLIKKMTMKRNSFSDDEKEEKYENEPLEDENEDTKNDFDSGNIIKEPKRKRKVFDMASPKLDKVVSKLKKIMKQGAAEDLEEDERTTDGDILDDDRISVRVTKIRDNEQELFDESDESLYVDDEDDMKAIKGDEKMKAATKKMENLVRKQLQDAGIKHEGKVKVKIITSKDALKRVAGGRTGFQLLSPDETNEFKNLLSNLLGGNREYMKEKERHEKMEDNYNLVWTKKGFTSAKQDHSTADHESGNSKK